MRDNDAFEDPDLARLLRRRRAKAARKRGYVIGIAMVTVLALVATVVVAISRRESGTRGGGGSPQAGGPALEYGGEYMGGNPIAADAKYKGKRVTRRRVEVERIDRLKDGRAYVAPLSVAMMGGPAMPAGTGGLGGHPVQRPPEPNYFYFVSDGEARKVKLGEVYDITGVCKGYVKDNSWRGAVSGMDWHVDFESCTLTPAKK